MIVYLVVLRIWIAYGLSITTRPTLSESLARKGITISPKVQILALEGRGLGLVAKEAIAKGEIIIQIPLKKCIVASPLEKSQTGEHLAQKLVAAWLKDKEDIGDKVLPKLERVHGLPVHWIDCDIPFPLKERVKTRRTRRATLMSELSDDDAILLSNALDTVSTRSFRLGATRSRTALLLAILLVSIAATNSVPFFYVPIFSLLLFLPRYFIGTDAVILAGADFMNHKANAKTRIVYNALFDAIQVRAESQIAGEEIALNYGEKSNDDFLLDWGFVLKDNVHDTVSINLKEHGVCRIGRFAQLTWLDQNLLPQSPHRKVDDHIYSLLQTAAISARDRFREEMKPTPSSLSKNQDNATSLTHSQRSQRNLGMQWRQGKVTLLDEFLAASPTSF